MKFVCNKCKFEIDIEPHDFPFHCICRQVWTVEDIDSNYIRPPAFIKRLHNYKLALKRWKQSGMPTRTDQEVDEIYSICQSCHLFNGKICRHENCGCKINKSPLAVVNKIRMATERCPIGKWGSANGIKLMDRKPVGHKFHYNGWPKVYESLKTIHENNGILFDDFIEQNFLYSSDIRTYKEPWIGCFHVPKPPIPKFATSSNIDDILSCKEFIESRKHLKGAIALTEDLANYLRPKLDCPVKVIKYPSIKTKLRWDIKAAKKNNQLLQLGWYLRDTHAISKIDNGMKKVRIINLKSGVVGAYHSRCKLRLNYGDYDNVKNLRYVPDDEYIKKLTSSVIFNKILAASANTVVIECIATNTPIIINKLPSVVEYLGEDYPLYYSDFEQASNFTWEDFEKAHIYLKHMDKTWLSYDYFNSQVLHFIGEINGD